MSPPFSVASLRQRLGRSGRRGEPAQMRAFFTETRAPSASLAIVGSLSTRIAKALKLKPDAPRVV
ncbi:MAG: hypothetical protein K2X54_29765 [Methylobacterium organophilum]|nr:hypothetical protein [Methylobacterium organophilum]